MKLEQFIATPRGRKVSQAEWARRVGVTRGYFCQMRNENKMPSMEVAYRIERVTEGKVTMQDWVQDLPEFKEDGSLGGSDDSGLRGEAT